MMTPKDFPKELYDAARALGVKKVSVAFRGGDDQEIVNVVAFDGRGELEENEDIQALCNQIQWWAYRAYDFRGNGDGTPYGESFVYDLKNRKVEVSEWFLTPSDEFGRETQRFSIDASRGMRRGF